MDKIKYYTTKKDVIEQVIVPALDVPDAYDLDYIYNECFDIFTLKHDKRRIQQVVSPARFLDVVEEARKPEAPHERDSGMDEIKYYTDKQDAIEKGIIPALVNPADYQLDHIYNECFDNIIMKSGELRVRQVVGPESFWTAVDAARKPKVPVEFAPEEPEETEAREESTVDPDPLEGIREARTEILQRYARMINDIAALALENPDAPQLDALNMAASIMHDAYGRLNSLINSMNNGLI
jgi:hypothetical protein